MEFVLKSVIDLRSFFDALLQNDAQRMEQARQAVVTSETEADVIKNKIRNHLPNSLFLPIDRRDLLDVLDMQDSIADTAEDIVTLLTLRRMSLPDKMNPSLREYVKLVTESVEMAHEVSKEFESVMESGFGRHQTERILEMIERVGAKETLTDEIGIELTKQLFEVEAQLNPPDVIFWYDIFQEIGDLADYAEKMGNRLRLLLAK